jgi:hypothetical protein
MRSAQRLRLVSAAALLLAITGGCSDEPARDGSRAPSPTQPSASATTVAAAPPRSKEGASDAASATVQTYYVIRNQLRKNPKQPLSLLKSVATSTELAGQQRLFKTERMQGLHQIGDTRVAKLEVQSINLENSDPKLGKVPTVQIDVCFDVSDVDVVGPNGESVVPSNRPDTGWIRYSVTNYEWTANPGGAWRVASSQDIERTPCAAS